ncbi:putative acetyltransferase (GNAT) family protein [Lyophyllum shimeji]|uniref:N-alpha-acetyltransferase 40 n=1 Tax=Lyophyllum shimeji TaxID=47721 RepID=A0A9P3PHT5_LYOSH|nr:putative acetyltransferase (GNAT) family protein [Lyophyllum shimeji]
MRPSPSVRSAIKASSNQLQQLLAGSGATATHPLRLLLSEELRETDKNAIWNLFEDNMRGLYTTTSFGWDPRRKREQLFDPLSRYILTDVDDRLAAFTMFRFESEDSEDNVYCYELQVHRDHQRAGLGKQHMRALEVIGDAWQMRKVVLTVFKENTSALKFYRGFGFSTDESSPNYLAESSVDYDILSKRLGVS